MNFSYSQNGEYFSIEAALNSPDDVKLLYLNYNFQKIEPIPEKIQELENLEELVLFPRMFDYPFIEKSNSNNASLRTIEELPNQIENCKKLKKINLNNSSIKRFPTKFRNLKNLEVLKLNNTEINLDEELNKLLKLKKLSRLEIINCSISVESLKKIRSNFPNLELFVTIDDLNEENQTNEEVDVQIFSTYLVFANERETDWFIKSLPKKIDYWQKHFRNESKK